MYIQHDKAICGDASRNTAVRLYVSATLSHTFQSSAWKIIAMTAGRFTNELVSCNLLKCAVSAFISGRPKSSPWVRK